MSLNFNFKKIVFFTFPCYSYKKGTDTRLTNWDLNFKLFCERLLIAGFRFLIEFNDPSVERLEGKTIDLQPEDMLYLMLLAFTTQSTRRQFAYTSDFILNLLNKFLNDSKRHLPSYYSGCFYSFCIKLDPTNLNLGIIDVTKSPAIVSKEKCHSMFSLYHTEWVNIPTKQQSFANPETDKVRLNSLNEQWLVKKYDEIEKATQKNIFSRRIVVELDNEDSIPFQAREFILYLIWKRFSFENEEKRPFEGEVDFPLSYGMFFNNPNFKAFS